jgi:hypothetical protein
MIDNYLQCETLAGREVELNQTPVSPSREICEQVARLDRKRLRQLYDVLQGDVPFAALDAAYVIPMQPGALCQFLLGIAPLVAKLPQPRAKSRLNGVWGHISMLGG